MPGATTVLGLCFAACALLLAGLPPLAGFLGKFAMLSAALGSGGLAAGGVAPSRSSSPALVIVSGLAALIALVARGHPHLLGLEDEELPAVPLVEIAPVVAPARADASR